MSGAVNWGHLALFYLVALIPLGLLWALHLRDLVRDMGIAIFRMTLQLLLVGLYLETVFAIDSLALNLAWLVVMVVVAAFSAGGRASLPKGQSLLPLSGAIFLATLPVLLLFLLVLSRPEPWFSARYMIPVAGMLLGNALGAIVIALRRFHQRSEADREAIELMLTMGASAYEARLPLIREAIRASTAPQIANMATLGVVSLPGMMTGQILGGANPMGAVQYQIAIILGISATQMLAILMAIAFTAKLDQPRATQQAR